MVQHLVMVVPVTAPMTTPATKAEVDARSSVAIVAVAAMAAAMTPTVMAMTEAAVVHQIGEPRGRGP
jgi:hypothetical protein